jgi:putative redox protein
MEAKATWQGDMAFLGTADTGFEVRMDAGEASGGHNSGFRPTELLAMGTAGCTGMDVISILRKKRAEVSALEVRVHVDQAETYPRVFTKMQIEYVVTGKNIKRADVERAVELSKEKYCPCIAMFKQVMEIEYLITIHEAEA